MGGGVRRILTSQKTNNLLAIKTFTDSKDLDDISFNDIIVSHQTILVGEISMGEVGNG